MLLVLYHPAAAIAAVYVAARPQRLGIIGVRVPA
jgi:hypothetical protein